MSNDKSELRDCERLSYHKFQITLFTSRCHQSETESPSDDVAKLLNYNVPTLAVSQVSLRSITMSWFSSMLELQIVVVAVMLKNH